MAGSREAYATLINDCIRGDATLFDRADSVEAAWELVDPILDAWQNGRAIVPELSRGQHGPAGSTRSYRSGGRAWRPL